MSPGSSDCAVDVRGLTVHHPRATGPALEAADLSVAAGESVVLLGRSGAGKTTLLHALLGAGPRAAGSVRVGGLDPFEASSRTAVRRRTGIVLQGGDLVPALRARTAAVTGSSHLLGRAGWWSLAAGRTPRAVAGRLHALAAEQGVEHLLERKVGELSGGERQRIALIRALLGEPALLLADEPTAGLDPRAADAAVDSLLAQRTALVVTTHDPVVAARFPRVVALRDGRVVHDGEPLPPAGMRALYAGAAT